MGDSATEAPALERLGSAARELREVLDGLAVSNEMVPAAVVLNFGIATLEALEDIKDHLHWAVYGNALHGSG